MESPSRCPSITLPQSSPTPATTTRCFYNDCEEEGILQCSSCSIFFFCSEEHRIASWHDIQQFHHALCGSAESPIIIPLVESEREPLVNGRLSKMCTPRSQVDLAFCDIQTLPDSLNCRQCKNPVATSRPPLPLDYILMQGDAIRAAFFYDRIEAKPIRDKQGVLNVYHSQCALALIIRCENNNNHIVTNGIRLRPSLFTRNRIPEQLWNSVMSGSIATEAKIVDQSIVAAKQCRFVDIPRFVEIESKTMAVDTVVELYSALPNASPSVIAKSRTQMGRRWRSDGIFSVTDVFLEAIHQKATYLPDIFEHPSDKDDSDFDGVVCYFQVPSRCAMPSAANWGLRVSIERVLMGECCRQTLLVADFPPKMTSARYMWPLSVTIGETIASPMMNHTAEGQDLSGVKLTTRTLTTKINDHVTKYYIQVVDVFCLLGPDFLLSPGKK